MDLLKKLNCYQEKEKGLFWEGTFKEYLELVKANPEITRCAHARIFDMIEASGINGAGENKKYNFFAGELFGLDNSLKMLVDEYFKPAALRLDVKKRILLLVGPVGCGKSTIVNLLKRGLEDYSRTDDGALYGIKGCPMHEEPLHLVPERLRQELERELGVKVEGSLCPRCRVMLREMYGGRIEDVVVERVIVSEQDRVGIGTFSPSDPKSQDIAELTGSMDFSTIAEYGSESDPRAYRFDGELNKANRGLMEFQELLKTDEKFLYNLLSLSQEGNFKAGRFALISADEVIIGHTNEIEFQRFLKDERNEALKSRLYVIPVPYNLRVSEEIKIYEKLIAQSDLKGGHLAPHTLRAAAIFSVLTRLKEPTKQGMDLVKKMKLYDGQMVEGFTQKDVEELKEEAPREGMEGIDPRFVFNRLSCTLASAEKGCVNALDVLKSLKEGLCRAPTLTPEERERFLDLIVLAKKEYDNILRSELRKVLIGTRGDLLQAMFERYMENLKLFCMGNRSEGRPGKGEKEPDEEFMASVEEKIGVSEGARGAFREEIFARFSIYSRKGKKFDLGSHPGLKEAIKEKLFSDICKLLKKRIYDSWGGVKGLSEDLIEKFGYCEICAGEMLDYFINLVE